MPNVRPLNKKKYGISKHAFGTAYSLSAISGMERGAGQQDINRQESSDNRNARGAQWQ